MSTVTFNYVSGTSRYFKIDFVGSPQSLVPSKVGSPGSSSLTPYLRDGFHDAQAVAEKLKSVSMAAESQSRSFAPGPGGSLSLEGAIALRMLQEGGIYSDDQRKHPIDQICRDMIDGSEIVKNPDDLIALAAFYGYNVSPADADFLYQTSRPLGEDFRERVLEAIHARRARDDERDTRAAEEAQWAIHIPGEDLLTGKFLLRGVRNLFSRIFSSALVTKDMRALAALKID